MGQEWINLLRMREINMYYLKRGWKILVFNFRKFYFFLFRPAESDINKFGLNWSAVWVKMGSSWTCVIVYLWVLFCRRCCPCCRDLSFPYKDDDEEIEVGESASLNHLPETITSRESVLWIKLYSNYLLSLRDIVIYFSN